jgi:PAS domain S-box-containing protein
MKGVMSDRDGTTGGLPIDPALDAALGKWFYQAPMALVCTDLQLRVVRVNDAFCQLLGLSADEMIGRRPSEYADTFDAEFIERTVAEEVIRKGLPLVDVHLTQRLPGGHERALAWSVFLLVDDDGRPIAACGALADVTERDETVRALRRAHSRLDLLERAGNAVGTTLDVYRSAAELADLAVPTFCDRFALDLLERMVTGAAEDAREGDALRLRRVAVRDTDPSRQTNFGVGDLIIAPVADSPSIPLVTREPLLIPDLAHYRGRALYTSGLRKALLAAGVHSFIIVPMIARGVTLGVAGFGRIETQGPYTEADLQLANDIISRAATSIDNARLYKREHETALTLQQSLLPATIPRVPGLATAHRYRAVSNAAQVGGDWFDVIPLQDGKVALVVGDVTGHDIRAAAVMGQLRTTVANLAPLGLAEAEIMNRLTQVVSSHGEEIGATCVYAVYDPGSRRCRFTTAGHLPPALRHPDGTVEFIDAPNNALLGLTRSDYEPVDIELAPGSTLVLYTDGLVEKPDQDIGTGMDRLAAALVAGPADQPLGQLSDNILARLGPYTDDDVALLLARTDTGDRFTTLTSASTLTRPT